MKPLPKTEAAFYRYLLEQIAADKRKTRARGLAVSGLVFWDSMQEEKRRKTKKHPFLTR